MSARTAGVPRANIITIVQLKDFLLSPHLPAGQVEVVAR